MRERLAKKEALAVDIFLGSLLCELADAAVALGFAFGMNARDMLSSSDMESARRLVLEKSGLNDFQPQVVKWEL